MLKRSVKISHVNRPAAAALWLCICLPVGFAWAATDYWHGGGTTALWSHSDNWDNLAPVNGDAVVFVCANPPISWCSGSGLQLTNTNDISSLSLTSITFNSPANACVLSGNSVTLTGNISTSSASLQTINFAMVFGATRTVTTTSGNMAIGGVISGAGGLTKAGSTYTLALTGANTYTGSTTISAGTLKAMSPPYRYYKFQVYATQGGTGIMQFSELEFYSSGTNHSGTIVVPGAYFSNGSWSAGEEPTKAYDNNTGTKYCTSTATLPQYVTYDFTTPMTMTGYDWASANDFTPARNPDNWIIMGSNDNSTWATLDTKAAGSGATPTGTTTYAAGWALSASGNALPIGTAVLISSGATLDLLASSQQIASLADGTGGGSVTNSGDIDATLIIGGSATTTFSGVISDGSTNKIALTMNSSGTQTLSGANTYTGTTTISNGTLKIQGVAFSTTPRTYSISSGKVLNIDGNTDVASGTTTINGTGTLYITGGNLWSNIATGHNITMSMGSGGLIDVESGATLTNGGWQNITWTANLADLNVDGTFDVWDGNPVTVDALTGGGTITRYYSANSGLLTVGANDGSGTFSGVINNTNPISLTKTGTGTQTLSGANSYTGATTVAQGTLKLGASSTLPSATVVTMGQSGNYTATLDLNGYNQTIAGLTEVSGNTGGANAIKVTNAGGSAVTLTINNSDDYSYDSTITNGAQALNLVKTGSGSQTLGGHNTYTGTTAINGGTLYITNTSGSATGTGAITVASGATLGGTGEATGNVTVSAGGSLSPGTTGNGQLKIKGNLALTNSTSTVSISLNGAGAGQYDQVFDTGTVNLAGATLSLALGGGFTPLNGQTFTIIDNDAADAITGTFAGLPNNPDTLTVGSSTFSISYTGGTGNDVVLTCYVLAENLPNWAYSQNLNLNTTASGANVATNQVNFPVLVRLTSSNFDFTQAQDAGGDLRFAKTNGVQLYYTIEQWDRVNQLAAVWVKVDTVYGNNGSQYFTMYWGNSAATSADNSNTVFSTANGFVAVYHLSEGGTTTRYNAAQNLYNGTPVNYDADKGRTGAIGKGDTLFSDDGISLADIDVTTALTLSAWVKPHAWAGYGKFISKQWSTNIAPWQSYTLQEDNSSPAKVAFGAAISGQKTTTTASALTQYNWTYVAGTYNYNSNGYLAAFFNGAADGTPLSVGTGGISGTDRNVTIGYSLDNAAERFNGIIDEARIENVARSPDWIKLCYQNQRPDGQTLVDFDDYSKWAFSRNITINTSGITTTDLANFPFLVRLNSANFDFNQAQSTGADIRFSKANGTHFKYQVERWDTTSSLAEIWVKVDTVLQNNATQYIKMYWGNSTATSLSNGNAVFDTGNGFVGVWHLNTSGAGYRPDATINNDSAKSKGTTFKQNGGVIAGCDTFVNASNQYDSVASIPSLANSNITVMAWSKLAVAAPSGSRFILGSGTGSNDQGLHFGYRQSSAKYTFAFFNDDLDQASAYSGGTSWHFIAGTYNTTGKVQKLYYDGALDNSRTAAANYTGTGSLRIGSSYDFLNPFDGNLDEVVVSNVVRTPDWIKLCYYNQQASSTVASITDSGDAFRPLSIKRNAGMDTVKVWNTRWGIKFLKSKGGGVGFLGPDTAAANNQLDSNLFCLLYKGDRSDTGASTLTMLDSSIVFTRIRQQKTVASQPFTIDYTVLGSGKMYARVTTFVPAGSSNLSGGLEFRVANNNTATTYRNVKYGASASSCQAVLHADSASGKFDILMAPYDLWTQANSITTNTRYTGIKSSTWSLGAGSRQTWNFMIDFSHKALHDSAAAWRYINDYRSSDTLSWYTGTPLLEKAWENRLFGHWKLDEQGGDTAGDASASASGLGNFGSIRGGGKWRAGMWGNADSLDGSDSITVKPGIAASFNGGNSGAGFTILGWVKPATALSTSTVLFQQMIGSGATATGYQLTGGSGGQLLLTLGNGSALVTLQGKTALNAGQWYHVGAEMTWMRDTLKLYVNGVLDTIRVGSWSGYPSSNTDSLDMGKGLNGMLDDMRFYGEALSDQQVKAIYLKGFSPNLGMYSVRADNNSQIQCVIHGVNTVRALPVFQINNYWSSNNPPTYVYATVNATDTAVLVNGTDYYASLDVGIKTLTVGFNREFPYNSTIYIGNSAVGQSVLTTMPQMDWGQATVGGSPHVWVKNFSGNYFGTAAQNNFFFDWKMTYGNATNTKNGEPWFFASSVTTPGVRLDTVALAASNLIPDYDGFNQGLNTLTLKPNNVSVMSTKTVTSSYTYSIAESSSVRVLLKVNTRTVKVTNDSFTLDTRWAIYPTGQIFVWDSLNRKSNALATGIYFGFMLDSLWGGTPTVTIPTPKSKLRAGISSSTIPDYIVAVTGFKNSGGIQAQPFGGGAVTDTIGAVTTNTDRVGAEFCNGSTSPDAMWGAMPVQVTAYLDFRRESPSSSSIDSIGVSVQHFPATALTMTTGTLNKTTWGDINQDGFSEGEGAYVMAATNNTVQFTVLTHVGTNDTCRYNPAFRITGYTGATEPQYVMVGGVLKTPNYGYNIYLNKPKQEVVLQLNQAICANTEIYLSYDRTLAVTMDRFNATPGDRNDTLRWRTESEEQNLGFFLYRRIKPSFLDSLLVKAMAPDADTTDNAVVCLHKRLISPADTSWGLVNANGLVFGAPQGKSYGPRNYDYIDYKVYNDIRYEYKLEAVDFSNKRALYKDYAEVMPGRILPKEFELRGNFPNPFRTATMIRFALPMKTKVNLQVYDLEGRLVRQLLDHEKRDAGFYKVGWDGRDDHRRPVASGPYIYRMTTPAFVKSRIMILAR